MSSLHRPLLTPPGSQVTRCACGWQSDTATYYTVEHDAAYDAHVIAALGVDAYYTAGAACRNCGHEQTATVLIGRSVRTTHCERCATDNLVPRNDVADEYRVPHEP